MRALCLDPVADTRRTYRALVDAMSRPGSLESVSATPADRAVLATLVDEEVTVRTADDSLGDALAAEGRRREAPIDSARVIHSTGSTEGAIREAPRGTLKEPSLGATVVYRLEELGDGAATTVRLEGPGVRGSRTLGVGLPAAELEAIGDAQADYPRGVDVVLTTTDRLACLPRSVTLEVI
ncbi:phosphonate C-P lyase system protein PhnH [Natronorubrum sp. DTA7]|uniref:phosphonate C-P lyase system protein PhnH n=1 Tax=Natronorubrum sp. DTA7 TaxID=3447016 RepID=UPI003F83074A